MADRIVVLHSGGMDSTVCLYSAHASGAVVISLGVDYGQRLSTELLFAQRHCDHLGIKRDVVKVAWQKPERSTPTHREVGEMRANVSPAFLPARNAVFLTLACAHAAGVQADEVHIGINSVDFSGYPDCTQEFLEAFKAMMKIAYPKGPRIIAPLLHMSKPAIAKRAAELGIGRNDTWSCYRPKIDNGSVTPCRVCDACKLHEFAWRGLSG